MQSIQLLALVTRTLEAEAPVLVRIVSNELQFMPMEPERLTDPANHDLWEPFQRCTADDLPELEEVVLALGGDPAAVLAGFPNCTAY